MLKMLALFCLTSFAIAQNLSLVQYKVSENLSKHYENMVRSRLEEYFNPNSFLVDTRVYYDETLVPSQYKRLASRLDFQLDALPGLPTLPKEMRGFDPNQEYHGDSLVASEYRKKSEIKFVDFTILIDSTYQVEHVEFILELVHMVADLDNARGDRVRVLKKSFPKSKSALLKEAAKAFTDKKNQVDITANEVGGIATRQANSGLHLGTLEWFLILLVLLAFMFMAWMNSRVLAIHSGEGTFKTISKLNKEFGLGIGKSNKEPTAVQSSEVKPILPVTVATKTAEYTELRTFLINQIIGSSKEASRVFSSWITGRKEEGIRRCAVVLNLVDPKVVTFLKSYLPEGDLIKLEMSLLSLGDVESDEEIELLQEFRKDFKNNELALSGDNKNGDLFNFLEQLTVNQIKHLVNGENEGIKGLILAQLKSARAAEILSDSEESERAKIMIQMGQIQNLTVKTYKEIAERLSQKAIGISNMKYVAADGVESIISVMLDLPTRSQGTYVAQIAEMDLDLASRIRQTYVQFSDLPTIDPRQLLTILDNLSKDTLSMALMKTEDTFVKGVLAVFPERAREMILSGMEGLMNSSLQDVEKARKELLTHVHLELKKIGGIKL